jgi:hypothetical protein
MPKRRARVGYLPQRKKLRVVGSQEVFMFPCGVVFRVIIPLYIVELSSLVARDSVLLVENLDGMCLVGQIRFQWDGIFDNNIGRRFLTSFEFGDMEHFMYS